MPDDPSGYLPSRRSFLWTSAATAAAACVPRSLWAHALSPNETLQVAQVGVGGMGGADLQQVASAPEVSILGLCDVDENRLQAAAEKHPAAQTFRDWRKLFDVHGKDLDAVVISTPDHMHGPIALAALQLGLHVYCQKPLAHNLRECRALAQLAERQQKVTQMGVQIHADPAYRTAVALIHDGILGKVSAAYLWVSKSWAGPVGGRPQKVDPVPANLDFDLWLGVAAERPYVEGLYHPARWRGWKDFGTGTLGDMGCHIFDPVFAALELKTPLEVTSRGPVHGEETFSADGHVTYKFAGTTRTTETLTLQWTDGPQARSHIPREQLPANAELPGAGSLLVGEKGVLVLPHWSLPRLYAGGDAVDPQVAPLPALNHYHEWANACRGEGQTTTPFSYSGPLTEAVLLGTLAADFPNQTLPFEAGPLSLSHPQAQEGVSRSYRDGWAVEALASKAAVGG